MTGGNWADLNITPPQDPVRGEPGAVRSQANALQQQARRWEEQARALQGLANDGDAMRMEGEFAAVIRKRLRRHPEAATLMARGCAEASNALNAYAQQLEQEKRNSQQALARGTQAKRAMETAERTIARLEAQRPRGTFYGAAYYAAVQRDQMLVAQIRQQQQVWRNAERALMAAQRDALQAGQRAAQHENAAAQKVAAAVPSRRNYDLAG